MRLIDADALIEELNASHFPGAPYVDAGISIAIRKVCDAPTIELSAHPEIVRCKDCKWWGDDDDGVVRVCHAAKHGHMSSNWSIMIYRTHKGDFYCADAERRTDDQS